MTAMSFDETVRRILDGKNFATVATVRPDGELIADEDKRLPRELSHKYLGEDPPREETDEIRLVVRVTPQKVIRFSA